MNDISMSFRLHVAVDLHNGLSRNGVLPWEQDDAMSSRVRKHYGSMCQRAVVVTDEQTAENLPESIIDAAVQLLIVTTDQQLVGCAFVKRVYCKTFNSALCIADKTLPGSVHIVIGGKEMCTVASQDNRCASIIVTKFLKNYDCDVFFEPLPSSLWQKELWSDESTQSWIFCYERRQEHGEQQYLRLIKEIVAFGNAKTDRTGTGTLSLFGRQMRFDLSESFPLLTTKKTFWKAIKKELLFFISGHTDTSVLEKGGVKIWKANTSRSFLDSRGLQDLPEKCLGAGYGFQWRHFGAEYDGPDTCYEGKGIDQLRLIEKCLLDDPHSRRMVMSAWNPAALHRMALPPCHILAQFYVDSRNRLSCQMYQRSCDMGLGVPFNIASYALLTCMLARVTNLKRGDFVYVLGDAHVYNNHVQPLLEQVQRDPLPFPSLRFDDGKSYESVDSFTDEDIILANYKAHPTIKMKMAV